MDNRWFKHGPSHLVRAMIASVASSWSKRQRGLQAEGQGLVEYALVLLLVAIVVIGIMFLMGPQIGSMFSGVTKGLH